MSFLMHTVLRNTHIQDTIKSGRWIPQLVGVCWLPQDVKCASASASATVTSNALEDYFPSLRHVERLRKETKLPQPLSQDNYSYVR